MFDDFFIRALFVGIGMALVTGPLGCFVVWRRLSFFGDTLAHSALLGITIAYTMEINIALSVFIISSVVALILLKLEKTTNLPTDALLGLLAHSSLAVGLVVIGLIATIRFDLMGLLFGDILAVNVNDIIIVWFGGCRSRRNETRESESYIYSFTCSNYCNFNKNGWIIINNWNAYFACCNC